jgi:hypothetical protein
MSLQNYLLVKININLANNKIGEKFEFNQLKLKVTTCSAKIITIKQFYEGNLLI